MVTEEQEKSSLRLSADWCQYSVNEISNFLQISSLLKKKQTLIS